MFLCTNHFKLYYYAFYLLNHRLTRIKSCSITRNNKVYYMNIPIRNVRRSLLQLRVKLEEKIYKYSFIHFKGIGSSKGNNCFKSRFSWMKARDKFTNITVWSFTDFYAKFIGYIYYWFDKRCKHIPLLHEISNRFFLA